MLVGQLIAQREKLGAVVAQNGEEAVLLAWCDLESAAGAPLLRFASTTDGGAARAGEGSR